MDIREIINRKKHGIDCTEGESAEIKGWLRETCDNLQFEDIPLLNEIQTLFPIEYGEFSEEHEQTI